MNKEDLMQMMNLIYEVVGDERLVDTIATMYWRLFNKLKEKGFTEDQALRIVQSFSAQAKK